MEISGIVLAGGMSRRLGRDKAVGQGPPSQLRGFHEQGWGTLPVCMAKTHLSLSDHPSLRGRPTGYTFHVSEVRPSIGAGFIYPIAGSIVTLPGLPSTPRALDVDEEGNILGL